MLKAGYAEKYAYHWNTKILESIGIKRAIAKHKANLAAKFEETEETIARKAEEHRLLALDKLDLSAANGALTIQAKCFGILKDKSISQSSDIPSMNEQQQAEARKIAEIIANQALDQNIIKIKSA